MQNYSKQKQPTSKPTLVANGTNGTKYSRMDKVNFVEKSLSQILLGPHLVHSLPQVLFSNQAELVIVGKEIETVKTRKQCNKDIPEVVNKMNRYALIHGTKAASDCFNINHPKYTFVDMYQQLEEKNGK